MTNRNPIYDEPSSTYNNSSVASETYTIELEEPETPSEDTITVLVGS